MKPLIPTSQNIRQAAGKIKKKSIAKAELLQAGSKRAQRQATTGTPHIELYQRESSPQCHSVRNRLSTLGLDFVAHSVPAGDDLKHEQLVHAGGKDQVPFLVDHRTGAKLYDSQAINTYLDSEYGREQTGNRVVRLARRFESRIKTRSDQVRWVVRQPIMKASTLRSSLNETVDSLRSSLETVRTIVRDAVKES